jgi:hypothetical protein
MPPRRLVLTEMPDGMATDSPNGRHLQPWKRDPGLHHRWAGNLRLVGMARRTWRDREQQDLTGAILQIAPHHLIFSAGREKKLDDATLPVDVHCVGLCRRNMRLLKDIFDKGNPDPDIAAPIRLDHSAPCFLTIVLSNTSCVHVGLFRDGRKGLYV